MSDKSLLKMFYSKLNDEEFFFSKYLENDNLGILLRGIINELDWYYYNLSNVSEPTTRQEEEYTVLSLGTCRAIYLSLSLRKTFDLPTVMFVRNNEITSRSLEIASALGMVDLGRRIAQTASHDLCDVEIKDNNIFYFNLKEDTVNHEHNERTLFNYYKSEQIRLSNEAKNKESWDDILENINNKLYEYVFTFEKHYIGYGGDEYLDEYFFATAFESIQLEEGYDTFNYKFKFGGIRFQNYMIALTYIYSIYIRHIQFAEKLIQKDKSVKLENILTISSETDGFIDNLVLAVNHFGDYFEDHDEIDKNQAKMIFDVLSIHRNNLPLLSAPGSPLPFIIQTSQESFIRCLAGINSEPCRFLLNSLNYSFKKDYDKNQNDREKSMQKAFKRVIGSDFGEISYLENINIKNKNQIITDIDLAVIKHETNEVILCQLKHQDPYGYDFNAKKLRSDRLKEQCSSWIDKINAWTDNTEFKEIKRIFKFPKSTKSIQLSILIFTRHYCYPLLDIANSTKYVFVTNYLQLLNSIEICKRDNKCNLNDLLKTIEEYALIQAPKYADEPTTKWIIRDLVFQTSNPN